MLSPERKVLQGELEAVKRLLDASHRDIASLEALLQEFRNGTAEHCSLELQLLSLKSLRQVHDQDCRRIRQEIAATL